MDYTEIKSEIDPEGLTGRYLNQKPFPDSIDIDIALDRLLHDERARGAATARNVSEWSREEALKCIEEKHGNKPEDDPEDGIVEELFGVSIKETVESLVLDESSGFISSPEPYANCNTCQNLERVKHEKKTGLYAGFLAGRCKKDGENGFVPFSQSRHENHYSDGIIEFHPSDRMDLTCYIQRSKG